MWCANRQASFHGKEQVDRLDKERLYFRCGTLFCISLVSGNFLPPSLPAHCGVQGYQALLCLFLQVQHHNSSPWWTALTLYSEKSFYLVNLSFRKELKQFLKNHLAHRPFYDTTQHHLGQRIITLMTGAVWRFPLQRGENGQLTLCTNTLPVEPFLPLHLSHCSMIICKIYSNHFHYTSYKPFEERGNLLFSCFPSSWLSS